MQRQMDDADGLAKVLEQPLDEVLGLKATDGGSDPFVRAPAAIGSLGRRSRLGDFCAAAGGCLGRRAALQREAIRSPVRDGRRAAAQEGDRRGKRPVILSGHLDARGGRGRAA